MRVPLVRNLFWNDTNTREQCASFVRHTNQLTMGPWVMEFERRFAEYIGRKHAVMVNSGSSANLLLAAWWAEHCGVATTIGVSALTWSTSVAPFLQMGFDVRPIDVEAATMSVDHLAAIQRWCPLFLTWPLGFSNGAPSLRPMWLDCCESLGSKLAGRHLGAYGDAATYSFFAGHHLCTIEGGMIVTDDDAMDEWLRMARAHGWDRDLPERKSDDEFMGRFTFHVAGFNVRPTELQGFIGSIQLDYLEQMSARRTEIWERLSAAQSFGIGIRHALSTVVPMAYPVVCESPEERLERLAKFAAAGVETRPLIAGNITRQPFWPGPPVELPGADHLHHCAFYAPLRPDMTEKEITIMEGCLR